MNSPLFNQGIFDGLLKLWVDVTMCNEVLISNNTIYPISQVSQCALNLPFSQTNLLNWTVGTSMMLVLRLMSMNQKAHGFRLTRSRPFFWMGST